MAWGGNSSGGGWGGGSGSKGWSGSSSSKGWSGKGGKKVNLDKLLNIKQPKTDMEKLQTQIGNLDTRLKSVGVDGNAGDDRNAVEKFLNLPTHTGFLGDVLNILDRPRNAVATAVHDASTKGDPLGGLANGFLGRDTHTFQEVLPSSFRKDHPYLSAGIGFAGDVLTDPTTYVGVGALKSVAKPVAGAVAKVATGSGKVAKQADEIAQLDSKLHGLSQQQRDIVNSLYSRAKSDGAPVSKQGQRSLELRQRVLERKANKEADALVNKGYGYELVDAPKTVSSPLQRARTNDLKGALGKAKKTGDAQTVDRLKTLLSKQEERQATKFRQPVMQTDKEFGRLSSAYAKETKTASKEMRNATKAAVSELKDAHKQGDVLNILRGTVGEVRKPQKGDAFYAEFSQLPKEVRNNKAFVAKGTAMSLDEAAQALGTDARSLLDHLSGYTRPDFHAEALSNPVVKRATDALDTARAEETAFQVMKPQFQNPVMEQVAQKVPVTDDAATIAQRILQQDKRYQGNAAKTDRLKQLEQEINTNPQLAALKQLHGQTFDKQYLLRGQEPRNFLQKGVGNAADFLGKTFVPRYGLEKLVGANGQNLAGIMKSYDKNLGYLRNMALNGAIDVARNLRLSESEMQDVLRVMENPSHAASARVMQAAAQLNGENAKWLQMAQQAGFDVKELEDYVKHSLTDLGKQYRERAGLTSGPTYKSGKSPATGKAKVEAGRKLDGTVDDINQQHGFDYFDPNAVRATAAGNYQKANAIAAQSLIDNILKNFGEEVSGEVKNSTHKVFNLSDKALYPEWAKSKQIALPKEVHDELQKLVEGIKSNEITKLFDKMTNVWKTMATTTPGFHIGNVLGGVFNNWLADIRNPKVYVWAKGIMDGKGSYTVGGRQMTGAEILTLYKKEGLASRGQFGGDINQSINNMVDMAARKGIDRLKYVAKNPLKGTAEFSRQKGQGTEDWLRLAHFVAKLDEGKTARQAADSVEKYLFNYDDISHNERTIKKFIPFYTWMRKNIPLQIEGLLTKTGTYTGYNHIQNNLGDALGVDPQNVPDYLKEQLALPIAGGGAVSKFFSPNLPLGDLSKLGAPGEMVISSLNPVLKLPIEMAMNKNTFTKQPIEKYGGEQKNYFGMDVNKNGLGYILDQFTPVRFANDMINPADGKEAKRPIIDRFLKPVDAQQVQKGKQYDQLNKLQDLVKNYEARTGQQIPTLDELKKLAQMQK